MNNDMGYGARRGPTMRTVMCEPLDVRELLKSQQNRTLKDDADTFVGHRHDDVDTDTVVCGSHDDDTLVCRTRRLGSDSEQLVSQSARSSDEIHDVTDRLTDDFSDQSSCKMPDKSLDFSGGFLNRQFRVNLSNKECELIRYEKLTSQSHSRSNSQDFICDSDACLTGRCDFDKCTIDRKDGKYLDNNLNENISVSNDATHGAKYLTSNIAIKSGKYIENIDDNCTNSRGCDNILNDPRIFDIKKETSDISDQVNPLETNARSNSKPANDVLSFNLTQDVAINIDGDSKISDVLESVPLVYIPSTRQLSLVDNDTRPQNERLLNDQNHLDITERNGKSVLKSKDNNYSTTSVETNSLHQDEFVQQRTSLHTDEYTKHRDSSPNEEQSKQRDSLHNEVKATLHEEQSNSSTNISNAQNDTIVSPPDSPHDQHEHVTLTDSPPASSHLVKLDFVDINLQSRNSYEPCKNLVVDSSFGGAKPKKKGFGTLFARNLFTKKTKDTNKPTESVPGWKLFGRVPPIYIPPKDNDSITSETSDTAKSNHVTRRGSANSFDENKRPLRKSIVEVSSTTALILENRPTNLPAKTPEEELRHRQQYEAMVEAARKKEQRDVKLKKRQRNQQLKQEEKLVSLSKFWVNDVLPNWEVMRNHKKTLDLWWHGLPPNIRGRVWQLAIGNDLNLTHELYEICHSRATDRIKMSETGEPFGNSETSSEPPSSKEASVELIKLDVSRTFPQLCIFQKGGPYHDLLHNLLGAYACYRPDVGYVQGMSFIAAVLILNMDVASAFVCFSNILNQPCQVAFFRIDEEVMKWYFLTFRDFFRENLPHLFDYLTGLHLEPEVYLFDWMFTLYSKSLPLDIACRVWDMFCRDGEEFLFRTALGIMKLYEDILLQLDFIHLAQFLTKLPESISADDLFRSIDSIKMVIDKKRFAQVLAIYRDQYKELTKDHT